jgi:hypothetical protein
MEYILFVSQDSIFGSRTILIPKNPFLEVRKSEYEIMKEYSLKNQVFAAGGCKYIVENFLEKIWNKNYGMLEKNEYTDICEKLHYYIDDYPFEIKSKDRIWRTQSIINLSSLNALESYSDILSSKEYAIIDSFVYMDLSDVCAYKNITDMLNHTNFKNF